MDFEALGLSFKWLFLIVGQMLDFLAGLIFHGKGTGDVAGFVRDDCHYWRSRALGHGDGAAHYRPF